MREAPARSERAGQRVRPRVALLSGPFCAMLSSFPWALGPRLVPTGLRLQEGLTSPQTLLGALYVEEKSFSYDLVPRHIDVWDRQPGWLPGLFRVTEGELKMV